MSPEKMVMMANQIATFFKTQPGENNAEKVADHINDFWEPRMRSMLISYVESGGKGLDPMVIDAMSTVRRPAA
ncbi:MAG: formate dehydrogenase [Rhodobacteraceae bacterium]|nr:formate dehydrogenase [Paracoccaceae bacterium]QEW23284.1 NADH-dependent formate dehydrogenase delta subunit FdsD [Paracoccaceae bacterium]